ncbi:hypothetical protein DPMN_053818 [Dreissena polymorpha]|uniref:Uncharacterized protein n=1 Tax=Dreissena polymorpha TaxID=45954 RepID=A0A9D4HSJ5_DREPO|nr:hypothetical protein DPMN_053818 [Dreissena polymorpha]
MCVLLSHDQGGYESPERSRISALCFRRPRGRTCPLFQRRYAMSPATASSVE